MKFADLQRLVEALGFEMKRIRGSHHYYVHPDLDEVVNIQPQNSQAKPYQVRQVAELVERYSLRVDHPQ